MIKKHVNILLILEKSETTKTMSNEIKTPQCSIQSSQNLALPDDNSMTHWVSNPYLKAATSDNTRKAYRSDIKHYETWGGKLPATPEWIVNYLQFFAEKIEYANVITTNNCFKTLAQLSRLS